MVVAMLRGRGGRGGGRRSVEAEAEVEAEGAFRVGREVIAFERAAMSAAGGAVAGIGLRLIDVPELLPVELTVPALLNFAWEGESTMRSSEEPSLWRRLGYEAKVRGLLAEARSLQRSLSFERRLRREGDMTVCIHDVETMSWMNVRRRM